MYHVHIFNEYEQALALPVPPRVTPNQPSKAEGPRPASADLIDALPLKKRLRAKTGGATFAHQLTPYSLPPSHLMVDGGGTTRGHSISAILQH